MSAPLRLALTPGEPAGIGPDLAIMLAQQPRAHELVAITDPALLRARADLLGLSLSLRTFETGMPARPDGAGELCVLPVALAADVQAGQLNVDNAAHVLATLDAAVQGCQSGRFAALVTAPVHKGVINEAGIAFTGHTEYLAEHTGAHPVMMLASGDFRVALVTTHLPLASVASAITAQRLQQVVRILATDLRRHFGVTRPRILVCGLNPHAGEGGHLGCEEVEVIEPALQGLRAEGLDLIGPLPADTLFTPQHLQGADAVLAMFHDQGLPVLKYAGFGQAVNVTLGLPIIRTSVDHGTALDKAGRGGIHTGSLQAAIDMAAAMAGRHSHACA